MDKLELVRLARLGAAARLTEIETERQTILRQFPNLRGQSVGADRTGTPEASNGRRRRRPGMSAAQRKAVGERMKKYWAARREANGASMPAKRTARKGARGARKMSAAARKRISDAQKARWAKVRARKGKAA